MATKSSTSPVTRETSAYVRDRGMRAIIVTVTGSLLELRAKGLRSREVLDIAFCYEAAIKQRLALEKAQRKAPRSAKLGRRR